MSKLGHYQLLAFIACMTLAGSPSRLLAQGLPMMAPGAFPVGGSPAATPTVDVGTGTYLSKKTVTLSCTTPSATIYYTHDGSTPTHSSSSVSSGGTVTTASAGETLKALCYAAGYSDSSVASWTYTTNLVAGWAMTDGSGATATGIVGGYNLALTNYSWAGAMSPLTNAVTFNGSTTKADDGTTAVADFERTDSFSFVTFFKNTSSSTTNFGYQALGGNLQGSTQYSGVEFGLQYRTGVGWVPHVYHISDYTGGNYVETYCNVGISTNAVHNLEFAYNGNSSWTGWSIYIDGTACTTSNAHNALTTSTVSNKDWFIGSRFDASSGLTGSIGASYVYRRAITSSEASAVNSGGPYQQ